jgi:hypothetical protein
MNTEGQTHTMQTISTALALCTSDVISGDLQMWRTHLRGIKDLLFSAVGKAGKQLTISDPTQLFLVKWFAALDVPAGCLVLAKVPFQMAGTGLSRQLWIPLEASWTNLWDIH